MIVKSFRLVKYLQAQFTSSLKTSTMQCLMEESGANGLGTEKHLKRAVTQKTGRSQRRYGTGRRGHVPSTQQNISVSQKLLHHEALHPKEFLPFCEVNLTISSCMNIVCNTCLSSMLLLKIKPTRSTLEIKSVRHKLEQAIFHYE